MKKRIASIIIAVSIAACVAIACAEAVSTLPLNDLSGYAAKLSEELSWNEDMLLESIAWKEASQRLDESAHIWISEAKDLLAQYFLDIYGENIAEKVASIGIYVCDDMPEFIGGFHGGAGDIYINSRDLDGGHVLNICLHEMIHALGVDFYEDERGILSNAFYEGCAEALAGRILMEYGYDYEDASTYGELVEYAQIFLECDDHLLTDIIVKEQRDIAGRIDGILEPGAGEQFLTALTLVNGGGSEDRDVLENIEIIVHAYERALR